jgi:zinc transporter ZupT
MNIYFIAFLTFVATILGGYVVFRYKKNFFHPIIAFSAGIFLAVAFFDLIPESFNIIKDSKLFSLFLVLGFLIFYILQKFTIVHAHGEEDCHDKKHEHIGLIGASGLIIHSFLDGLAIGLAFTIDVKIALIVSIAVIAHKVADGIGLVSVMLHHNNSNKKSVILLVVDAVVPVIGIFVAGFTNIPEVYVGLLLAFFAGFFIYIGASDLLPEAHSKDNSIKILFATVMGFAVIYFMNIFITI